METVEWSTAMRSTREMKNRKVGGDDRKCRRKDYAQMNLDQDRARCLKIIKLLIALCKVIHVTKI